jgi:MFS superfamily sulfate permease-like transporter
VCLKNAACGAKTPFSLSLTIVGVLICLTSLTKALRFIPQAALAAIIFCAIANLINFTDLWHSWKYSKKDFFTNLVTLVMVFCFDTSVGLAAGIACSVVVYCVFDIILAKSHAPRLFSTTRDEHDVDVVRIESDLNFLTSSRVKDFITALALEIPVRPEVTNRSEYIRFQISAVFDFALKPDLLVGVEKLPKAVVIDLCIVKTVDITGLEGLAGAIKEVRSKGVLVAVINANPDINAILKRYGIKSDKSTAEINFDEYEQAYRLDLWSLGDKMSRLEAGKSFLPDDTAGVEAVQSHFMEVELATVGGVSEHGYAGVPTNTEFKSMDIRMSALTDRSEHSL